MVCMFIFRHWIRKWIGQKGEKTDAMTFLVSTAIDADFALNWVYYHETKHNDMIENNLKMPLLVFSIIGTLAWLFIASDGWLYEKLFQCFASSRACVREYIEGTLRACKLPVCIRKLIWQCLTFVPLLKYSPGWFSLFGIIFADIAQLVLTTLIDNYGVGSLSPVGVGNITSSAYDLLIKATEAYYAEKRPISGIDCEVFNHGHGHFIIAVLQLSDDQIITASSKQSIKVWNISNGNCIHTIAADVSWIARLDDDHILVGTTNCPYIARYHVCRNHALQEVFPPPGPFGTDNPCPIFDLGPIMAVFPGNILTLQLQFVAQLQANVERGDDLIRCATKYGANSLIGGMSTGKVYIWNKENPEHHASFNVAGPFEDVLFVACLEVNNDPRIITRTKTNIRRVWKVSDMNLASQTLTLEELSRARKVSAVAIFDADRIVEGTTDGHVRVFDLNTGSYTRTFMAHFQEVSSIYAFSDNRILTGISDGTAQLWPSEKARSKL